MVLSEVNLLNLKIILNQLQKGLIKIFQVIIHTRVNNAKFQMLMLKLILTYKEQFHHLEFMQVFILHKVLLFHQAYRHLEELIILKLKDNLITLTFCKLLSLIQV